MSKISVIGAGVGGLAVAIRLALKGHEVDVFEANPYAGGKITELRANGFRWDMGPSVLTMPAYIDELFHLAGENPKDHFTYHRLDPVFRYFFNDGTVINTYANFDQLAEEFEQKTGLKKERLRAFFIDCATKLELTDPVFLQRSLHIWKNYFDTATLRGILNFGKVGAFSTMAQANAKMLNNPKAEAIFNQYASYNGSDPFQAPSTLNLIAHYELGLGAFYPEGGMHSVTTALVGLAQRVGAKVHVNSRVEAINHSNKKVVGLTVNGQIVPASGVVANADVHSVYNKLLHNVQGPKLSLAQPLSSSVIVFYWGVKGQFAQLGLHNMFMGNDQKGEYQAVFRSARIAPDPTIYLYISSTLNPTDAPEGHQNWFVMVTVPHHTGQNWDALVALTRKAVLAHLSNQLKTSVEDQIVSEEVLTPPRIEQRTSSSRGAVYGNSSNGIFAAFLRHANFSKKIEGLYFCGGSVHPGPSVPLSLLSAKITAGLVR